MHISGGVLRFLDAWGSTMLAILQNRWFKMIGSVKIILSLIVLSYTNTPVSLGDGSFMWPMGLSYDGSNIFQFCDFEFSTEDRAILEFFVFFRF